MLLGSVQVIALNDRVEIKAVVRLELVKFEKQFGVNRQRK